MLFRLGQNRLVNTNSTKIKRFVFRLKEGIQRSEHLNYVLTVLFNNTFY